MQETTPVIELMVLVGLILALGVITGVAVRALDRRQPLPH
jgi:hypothetical protein